ncbi:hypothetical protein [Pseudodesulfovibrio sp. zrk46]|uniref:hypothetical protein n=1 Tax=Pseudodesulfovibrio sp. zrk46 TaxID=2725288 RepID=UPI001449B0E8|nr:hypothetical protein [Pseudodesulfovibrio sp. zrk46]QJB56561.1 hypothetical protein HFN16_09125 [Pseudodesulfovibrio sp. zrk46]
MNIEWASLLTEANMFFFVPIAVCLGLGLVKGGGERSRFTSSLPGVAISLGILGTFTGIFIGLLGFQESDISGSIPRLLGGMKTAFATSLLGMATSIVLKGYYAIRDDRKPQGSDDPIKSLQKIESAIVSCFRSDEEYSLVSQVKLIRQELIDSRRETKAAFQDFAEQFSKMASESLISELQQVVDKFNVMLNELVSESFKELSDSTIRLNEWQQEYKTIIDKNQGQLRETLTQVEELRRTFSEIASRLGELDSSFESIDLSLTAISTSGSELDEHSKALSSQNLLLEESIKSIRDVGREASQVVPTISEKMNTIITDIGSLQLKTNEFVREVTDRIESGVEEVTDTLSAQSEELQATTNAFVKDSTKELKAGFDLLAKGTQEHVEAIEKALEEELTKSLNSLAGALTALSNQFVSDYTPLTERLREVIVLAENGNVRTN